MARIPIRLSDADQAVVAAERDSHPDLHVRRKMLVLWSVHTGLLHSQAVATVSRATVSRATVSRATVSRATVQRCLAAYRKAGLDGLRRWGVVGPVRALAAHAETIKAALVQQPARTVAEAAQRVEQLSGLRRGNSQTRVFLQSLGFRWKRTRAVPVPPKSRWPSMSPSSASS